MYCKSNREERVIDSINDDGNDISDDFQKENERSWSRSPTQGQSNKEVEVLSFSRDCWRDRDSSG